MNAELLLWIVSIVSGALALGLLYAMTQLAAKNSRIRNLADASTESALKLAARDAESGHLQQRLQDLQQQHHHQSEQAQTLREQVARLDNTLHLERQQQQEKLQLLQQAREQMNLEFRQLANDILEQKGKSLHEASNQQLQQLLQPLREKLGSFEKKVEDTYDKESKQRFALEKEIKSLLELNARISADATNLTNALKGENKTQGIWGEVILERVLERSGLERGREYEVQVSLKDEEGRKGQPDVIVHLPENKDIVIDSKVSLTAYQGYFGIADEDQRQQLLKQHILSIRTHIKGLSSRNYQNLPGLRSLDYVLLFLPVEAAFTLAVQHDDGLFTEAFEQNIMLVSPSTLLVTLRTIRNIWRYEYQSKNAQEIAQQAGLLYDKFVAFAQDLDKIGERLGQTQDAWQAAHNKLSSGRGNLVNRTQKLKTLGAKASKSLPQQLLEEDSEELGEASVSDKSGTRSLDINSLDINPLNPNSSDSSSPDSSA